MSSVRVEDIIEKLELEELPVDGGLFKSTYHSEEKTGDKEMCNAIYYMLRDNAFSHLHKLPNDEIYHHYMGDPIEMLELRPEWTEKVKVVMTSGNKDPEEWADIIGGKAYKKELVNLKLDIWNLILTLKPAWQEILIKYYFQRYTWEQIADMKECSYTAVNKMKKNALNKLDKMLEG